MEDKEFVNPQTGEKYQKKEKPFWKEWKFWLYSIIAVLLFIVSASSMTTACHAIKAGVGQESKEDAPSSLKMAPKRSGTFAGWYYSTINFSNVARSGGNLCNFSSSPVLFSNWFDSESMSGSNVYDLLLYSGDPSVAANTGFIFTNLNPYHFALRIGGVVPYDRWDRSYVDLYKNGSFWMTYKLGSQEVLDEDLMKLAFTRDDYVWIFNHDDYVQGYEQGLENGLTYSDGFSNFALSDTFYVDGWSSASVTNGVKRVKFFDFYSSVSGDWYSVAMVGMGADPTTFDDFRISVYDGRDPSFSSAVLTMGYGVYQDGRYVGGKAFGNGNLPFGGAEGEYFIVGDKTNFTAFYTFVFDWYKYGSDPLAEIRQEGYEEGYAVGRVDGLNAADPEALTNTLVAVFQQPFDQIYRFFNFNVLGLNILGLVTGLITIFVVVKVVKKII